MGYREVTPNPGESNGNKLENEAEAGLYRALVGKIANAGLGFGVGAPFCPAPAGPVDLDARRMGFPGVPHLQCPTPECPSAQCEPRSVSGAPNPGLSLQWVSMFRGLETWFNGDLELASNFESNIPGKSE